MATNIEINELKINKMSEATLSDLEKNNNIQPNQIFFTDDDGDALNNVLQIDVLYDMRDSNKDLNKSGGVSYNSSLALDMRKYKFVKAFARWGTNARGCGILDLTNDFAEYNNTCQTCISAKSVSSSDSDTYWFIISSSTDKRTLHIEKAGYDTFTERKTCGVNTTLEAFVTRLEGWY